MCEFEERGLPWLWFLGASAAANGIIKTKWNSRSSRIYLEISVTGTVNCVAVAVAVSLIALNVCHLDVIFRMKYIVIFDDAQWKKRHNTKSPHDDNFSSHFSNGVFLLCFCLGLSVTNGCEIVRLWRFSSLLWVARNTASHVQQLVVQSLSI